MLFKDPVKDSLYGILTEPTENGEWYVRDTVRYPNIGITGKFFLDK